MRGATFRWRPWLLVAIAPWVAALIANLLAGKPAVMTNVIAGSLELAAPISMAAMAGILSERSGMLNIALEGKMLIGACVASVVASVVMLATGNVLLATLDRHRRRDARGGPAGPAPGLARHPPQGRPDHRRHRHQHRRHRHHELPLPADPVRATEFNSPPPVQPVRIPLLADIPVLGPIFFVAKPYVYVGTRWSPS